MMTIFPAIDLKDGKAVRLTKGLMESAKVYSDTPWELVKTFEEKYQGNLNRCCGE